VRAVEEYILDGRVGMCSLELNGTCIHGTREEGVRGIWKVQSDVTHLYLQSPNPLTNDRKLYDTHKTSLTCPNQCYSTRPVCIVNIDVVSCY
jgi:hypothetical protein